MAQAQPVLSNKDNALFRQLVRHFENKQYKKGSAPTTLRMNEADIFRQA